MEETSLIDSDKHIQEVCVAMKKECCNNANKKGKSKCLCEFAALIDSPTESADSASNGGLFSCGGCAMFPSCMSLLPKRNEQLGPRPGQVPVILNVYDMYWTNWYTAGAGVGVFHSGVQVHGSEWAYGGHPYSFTGVFEISPRDSRELGEQFHFRQSVQIGYTDFSEEEVRRLVSELGKQFRGDRYHLMNNNCNHFSSAFCQALCSRDIPSWVNRLAYVSSCVPFLQRCLPKSLGPPLLKLCPSEPDRCAWHSARCEAGPPRCRSDPARCAASEACQEEAERCDTRGECDTSEACASVPCTQRGQESDTPHFREWLTPAALRHSLEAHSRESTPQTPQ